MFLVHSLNGTPGSLLSISSMVTKALQMPEIVMGLLTFLTWVLDPSVDKFPCVLLRVHL